LVSKGFAKQKAFVGGVEMPDLATENWLMPTLMLMMMMMVLMLMLMLMLLMIIQKMFRMTKQDVRCIPGLRRNTPSWLASQGAQVP
jgi:heme/copper-type cytochrome/quinol oxidase subunit 2